MAKTRASDDCIPVYHADGRLFRFMTALQLHTLANVRLCANKRGYVHRAYLTGQAPQRPEAQGNAGQTYSEPTAFGPVWSMKIEPGHSLDIAKWGARHQ